MKRLSKNEIAQLFDKRDWAALWKIMEPMVKHTVKRCMQEGLDPFYVNEDLMQEAYLAAWKALPKWNAFEGGLMTWVRESVRSAVLHTNQRETTGMVGGREANAYVVSMHGETPDDDLLSDEEQGLGNGVEAALSYEDPPLGLTDPADEQYLLAIPLEDRDMVRRLAGLGVPRETQAEYAAAEGVHRNTVVARLLSLKQYLCKKA